MSTDVDWQHELDSSFGTGHDLPPGHYVAAGQDGRTPAAADDRPRRWPRSVLVAGSAAWATAPDPSTRGDAPVATQGPSPDQDGQQEERRDRRAT